MSDLQSELAKTQQQISASRKILTPSDDPVGAARALEVTQSQSINTQYGVNRQRANSALSEAEVVLSSVTSLIQDVKDTIIAAGNTSIGDTGRASQATALRGRLEQLVGLANSRDGTGNYMFSGFKTDTPAFVQTAAGVQYQGDQGQRLIQVDATRQMAISSPGQAVFQGGGQDMFQTLSDLITQLETPGTAGLNTALATANSNMDLALDNVLTIRAAGGTRLQEIDSLNIVGVDRGLQYSQTLSELQDLDYNQALTKLSQLQFTLEAAQRSFSSTSKLSLFNYI